MPEPQFTEPELAEPLEIEIGGAILELPAGASEDAVKQAVETFRASPEFDKLVDKNTGAPARVRGIVGGAPLKDRLANLKQFFPDAQPFGSDNFVFSNPETGRPTLYNPEGLDVGDVASVGREATQTVFAGGGAIVGAGAGFLTGAPTGPGVVLTTPTGAAIGAGLGSAAGGSLFDFVMNMSGRIDTRSFLESTLDTALDFFGGAAGQRGGELIGEGFKVAVGSTKEGARRLAEAFARLRVEPPAGAVTGSRAIGSLEKGLESTFTATSVMQQQAERVIAQTRAAAEKLAGKFGPVKTVAGAGETIKAAAVRAAERFGFTQERAYTEAFDLVGETTPVAVPAIAELRQAMMAELARAPKSLKRALDSALGMLRSIEADAAEGGIEFAALRQIRTGIGKDIATPQLSGSTGAQNEGLKRIYAALTLDLGTAARQAGPKAAKKLDVADRFTRLFMTTSNKTLTKIAKFDADEKAFNFVMSTTKDGAQMLARLRRHFTPEEFDTVAATILGRLGLARQGAQNATGDAFSVNTFLTNWSRMTPEAKKILFGGPRYRDLVEPLDDLVRVVGSLKEMEKLANTSNTGRVMATYMTLQTLGGTLGAFAGGDVQSGAAGVLGALVAPRVAAKLITSPRFIKWLLTPVTSPNGIGAHLGRLVGIAEAEPELREEIAQYVAAMRPAEKVAGPPIPFSSQAEVPVQ